MMAITQIRKTSRKYHKWLMTLLALQFVVWSVTGTYMVFFDIHYIHGDTLVNNRQDKIDPQQLTYPLHNVLQRYPKAKDISLGLYLEQVVYRFSLGPDNIMLDARTGQRIAALSRQQAAVAAKFYYAGNGEVASIELLTEHAPFELNPKALPAWRVNFTDLGDPAIYVSAETGLLVAKRHNFWRLFDWMFRFHVMDHNDGKDIDNLLLFLCSVLGLISTMFGLVLLYFSLSRPKRALRAKP
ncbi:PepSY domain-containing protein [Rheinheimera maricola]|uniref:PepSY domain-containing protein n=1 Tax=Rheinheimera maricola TaxID=2793282 RepID=A0ABS7XEF3_9GAMM|nr:PepSY domain-containing protein [Rheinheimera maricola]MBZ9613137.1 PepSY domain-containing protein [Rheinheimera maricola]